jgi:hypothetical protein
MEYNITRDMEMEFYKDTNVSSIYGSQQLLTNEIIDIMIALPTIIAHGIAIEYVYEIVCSIKC